MSARTILVDGVTHIDFRCDGCGTPAPPPEAIREAHGLIRMGWDCRGGTHYCPPCAGKRDEAAAVPL